MSSQVTGRLSSGDTIFSRGGYGRYDLPTGNVTELVQSIKKLLSYQENCEIYSGHGEVDTILNVKKFF